LTVITHSCNAGGFFQLAGARHPQPFGTCWKNWDDLRNKKLLLTKSSARLATNQASLAIF
jgi:hypothetical protein